MGVIQTTGKLQRDSVSGAQTFTNAFPANATAGNTCVLVLTHFTSTASSFATGVTIGGTAATRDIRAVSADNANVLEVWRATSVTGGTRDVVVTLTATAGQFLTCSAEEWDNISTSSPLDASGTGGPTTSSAPSASTSASTTQTPILLYGGFTDYAGTNWTSATPPSGWTETYEEFDGTAHEAGAGGYFVDSGATGTKTGTWATGASMSWVAGIVAYKLTATVAEQPPSQVYFPDAVAEAEPEDWGDPSPYAWYTEGATPGRANAVADTPQPQLPNSFEWEDPNAEIALFQWPWGTGPPPADVFPGLQSHITDSSQQPEWPAREDENFGFELAPLAPDQSEFDDQIYFVTGGQPDPLDDPEDFGFAAAPFDAPAVAEQLPQVDDADAQLEDPEEPFGFDVPPLADDNDVAASMDDDDAGDQIEYEAEDFGFTADPLPDDVQSDQVFTEDSANQLPRPEDDEDYGFTFDGVGPDFTTDQGGQDDAADQLEDADEDFGFAAGPLADDAPTDQTPQSEDAEWQIEDADEDFGFFDAPLPEDSPQLGIVEDASGQPTDPEDEPFGFDAGPLADSVEDPLPFCECSDAQPDDVIEEPQGFTHEPIQPDEVIEEPLPFCAFPDQANEPEDEDFGFSDFQTPDDVFPPPVQDQGASGLGDYASTVIAKRRRAELDQQLARQRQAEAAAAEVVAERERALVRAKSEATKERERARLAKAQAQQAEQSRLADLIAQELALLMAEELRASALTRDSEEEEALLLLLLA